MIHTINTEADMKRGEIIERGVVALRQLIAEHGGNNRFLASELRQWDGALGPMVVGRFGGEIALAAEHDMRQFVITYEQRQHWSNDPRKTHSYFCVENG